MARAIVVGFWYVMDYKLVTPVTNPSTAAGSQMSMTGHKAMRQGASD